MKPFVRVNLALLSILSLLSMNAGAADRQLGRVIAVEREIDSVYQTCVDQVKQDPQHLTSFFFCKFEATKNKVEYSIGEQRVLQLDKDGCMVEAVVMNSVLLVTFGTNPSRNNFEAAKTCLRKALDASPDKDHFKFIIYSIE